MAFDKLVVISILINQILFIEKGKKQLASNIIYLKFKSSNPFLTIAEREPN